MDDQHEGDARHRLTYGMLMMSQHHMLMTDGQTPRRSDDKSIHSY